MQKEFDKHPTKNHFALGNLRENKWPEYKIVDEVLYPKNEVVGSATASQKLRYEIPEYGLLNKLIARIKVTFNDDSVITTSNGIRWTGIQFIEKAKLYCGKELMYEIQGVNVLSHIEQSSSTDHIIYNEAIPYEKNDYPTSTSGLQYVYYCPLVFDCFNSPDNLLDTIYMQKFMLELDVRNCSACLTNDSYDFTLDSVDLLTQYIEVMDYDKYVKQRFKVPYNYLTVDFFHEKKERYTGVAGTSYTTPFVEIGCNKLAINTFITVKDFGDPRHLNLCQIERVRIKKNDRIIYDTTDDEHFLLHHLEYRHHEHTKDNIHKDNTLLHTIPWGVFSNTDISNYKDFSGDDKYHISVTFLPPSNGDYDMVIFHETYKKYTFDKKGEIIKVFH